jgi:hypothetical protein
VGVKKEWGLDMIERKKASPLRKGGDWPEKKFQRKGGPEEIPASDAF